MSSLEVLEYKDTGRDVEDYILPMMRRHGIRFVQVARHGHREADGITVLDDSREPIKIFLEGDYKLSDELTRNGTVPQYGGVHRCALKFKAWVIEQWLETNLRGHAHHAFGYNAEERKRISQSEHASRERIAFGFNADETRRIDRSCEYNSLTRQAFYPLLEWNWTRARCVDYIREELGVTWRKSACVYCPFNSLENEAIERHLEHPEQVADALLLEHVRIFSSGPGWSGSGETTRRRAVRSPGTSSRASSSGRWTAGRATRSDRRMPGSSTARAATSLSWTSGDRRRGTSRASWSRSGPHRAQAARACAWP